MEAVDNSELREALAEYAHEAWSGWMKYLFDKGVIEPHYANGKQEMVYIMPAWAVERWTRQMNTPYTELSEAEKNSDRAEADKMLAIVQAHEPPLWQQMGYDEQSVAQNDLD